MPDNKKHHYVPRFYLKRFSKGGKSISLWNIARGRLVLSANLKNQCYKDYFYGKELEVEDALSQTEANTAEIFRKIDAWDCPPPYGSSDHFLLMFYVITQHGRTAYAVDAINEMTDKMTKHAFKHKFEEEGLDPNQFTIGLKDAARRVLGLTASNLPLLLDLDYKLLINNTPVDFVTSDNPVIFYNQLLEFRTFGSNTGLASKGLQIFLPLDSKKQLFFYDRDVYRVGSKKSPVVDVTQPMDVYQLNTLQMCSASENIYFENEELDVFSLHHKAFPFLRKNKSNMKVIPDGETSELIASSSEDIRTRLKLSFSDITKRNRRWQMDLMKSTLQPAIFLRDQEWFDSHNEFMKKVKGQKLDIGTYFRLVEEAFCQE